MVIAAAAMPRTNAIMEIPPALCLFWGDYINDAVGWAIRAFTPVFDGPWALARHFHCDQTYRTPCPRGLSHLLGGVTAWARRTRGLNTLPHIASAFAHPTA